MRVAVIFGGRSPEHDVSILTGLQVIEAIDPQSYTPYPVYIALDGSWWTGDPLRNRSFYIPNQDDFGKLKQVRLQVGSNREGIGRLMPVQSGLISKPKPIEFDVAVLALHGSSGENGALQGCLELANVPYTGMRPLASAVLMDKISTKRMLANSNIPQLAYGVIKRPKVGLFPSDVTLASAIADLTFPLIVKPANLGSSIGIARVNNLDDLKATLPVILSLDTHAIVEPFVDHLTEYNISVRIDENGETVTSAIERPKYSQELLDFKAKYLSSGVKGGAKAAGAQSEGMLSLTRDIDPPLSPELEANIRSWAVRCFAAVDGSGAPRIDFISNGKTGETWLNEVNPCPGSFSSFLWSAAAVPVLFTDLLSAMIDEGFDLHTRRQMSDDPTLSDARLFPRK